ncbi:NAD dependent epimerase/dehydratase family protein [Sarocladium implicatum]|nr:NAD dependent epimerase/dehydratase family protein [Sarocladium implicatum]
MAPYDVLVTGSSGHLGAALMLSLPDLGFNPLGIDILPAPTTQRVGSIADRAFVHSILHGSHIKHVLHAATLHKPHVETHSKEQFIETNITGTLILLEEAAALGNQVESFVFLSTTSTFGNALSPKPGSPAAWIDESVVPQPKNMYGVTKVAAEDMCFLVHKQTSLPVIVLRTSRFFNEQDDDEDRRNAMSDENLKVLELAYRRVDMADIVSACNLAMQRAVDIKWDKFIISAPPPFSNDSPTLAALDNDPHKVFAAMNPNVDPVFEARGWKHLRRIDRVYDSSKAIKKLGWIPEYTFNSAIQRLKDGEHDTWRSELAKKIGKKGYHAMSIGVYTVR